LNGKHETKKKRFLLSCRQKSNKTEVVRRLRYFSLQVKKKQKKNKKKPKRKGEMTDEKKHAKSFGETVAETIREKEIRIERISTLGLIRIR
jgi:hypothetical protein